LTQTEIRLERKFEIIVPQITDSFSDAEELYTGHNGGHKFFLLANYHGGTELDFTATRA
jgi:hypothetical protein